MKMKIRKENNKELSLLLTILTVGFSIDIVLLTSSDAELYFANI